jgi:proline racemase
MIKAHMLDVIYTHSSGGPLCIVHSGVRYPAGLDIVGKRKFLEKNYDWMRRALMLEPRGHKDMFGVFLTPPSSDDTDGGMIWMCGAGWLNGCGHGTIGLGMAMVSQGLVTPTQPITKLRMETTAGIVNAEVSVTDHTVDWIQFENVPAFVAEKDVSFEVAGLGEMKADIAFGGNFFAIVHWDRPDIKIAPENGSRFQLLGQQIKEALSKKVRIRHPVHAHIADNIDLVTFYNRDVTRSDAFIKNAHFYGNRQIARSPGGTSLSALLAVFENRGMVKIGQDIAVEGILGADAGYFEGRILREAKIGNNHAIVPRIKGRANLVGYGKWLMDPNDSVSAGYEII